MKTDDGLYDRSYLPPARFEFVVLADTHHIVDPDMYPASGDSVTPELTRDWSARGDWALSRVVAMNSPLVFHVGDLAQEYPGHETFDRGRVAAREQFDRSGLSVNFIPGNMDIGDKPDATMPAGWVRATDLQRWHADFGPSYYSMTRNGVHFAVVNSQVLNTTLDEGANQKAWLEADLATHGGSRIVLLLHMPLFLVDANEPGLGSYDVVDEPDRSWLLDLIQRYEVEAVFSGHTHFRIFNRFGPTRLFTLPSTTTTRPGFYEAFPTPPPSRGWADLPKLGFFLVRVLPGGLAVHLVRTSGRTSNVDGPSRAVLTCTTREMPGSPMGANLRLPLASKSDGAIAYPNQVRNRIRDDHPLLSCLELGLGHVRFPIHDLDQELQLSRLSVLRDEGVSLTGFWIWATGDPPETKIGGQLDCTEVQLAGRILPTAHEIAHISELRSPDHAVALAPIQMERISTVHGRSRTGYNRDELTALDEFLRSQGALIDRAVCAVAGVVGSTWSAIRDLCDIQTQSIGALDLVLKLTTDDAANCRIVAEGMLSAATLPNCRLFLDPLQELDRTAAVMGGLLDRLSNPRPAFHVARVLNTVIFGVRPMRAYEALEVPGALAQSQVHGIGTGQRELWLMTKHDGSPAAGAIVARSERWRHASVIELETGGLVEVVDQDVEGALAACNGRMVLICLDTPISG